MGARDYQAEALAAVQAFLQSSTGLASGVVLTAETPLLEGDVLDSLGVLQLATQLEERFGLQVSDEDFIPENFETIGSLAHFIARRLEAAA